MHSVKEQKAKKRVREKVLLICTASAVTKDPWKDPSSLLKESGAKTPDAGDDISHITRKRQKEVALRRQRASGIRKFQQKSHRKTCK